MFEIVLDSLAFGLAVAFILLGLIGTLIPLIPGPLLIWATVLAYAIVDDFTLISQLMFGLITLVLAVTGTAEFWLPLLGAKATGGSKRAMVYGVVGGLAGLIWLPPLGSIIGYGLGVLLGSYQTHGDWNIAIKASLGGLAGQGLASIVQLGGGVITLGLFVYTILEAT